MIVWDYLVIGALGEQDESVQNTQMNKQANNGANGNATSESLLHDTLDPNRANCRSVALQIRNYLFNIRH